MPHLWSTIRMSVLAAAVATWPALVSAEARLDLGTMRSTSTEIATEYLATWSASNQAALAQVAHLYAPKVSFFGRRLDRQALRREKAHFIQRWPVRSYTHRPGTMGVTCDPERRRCLVRSIMDWHAEGRRSLVSRGSARFVQGIDFSAGRPSVFLESGSVLVRHGASRRSGFRS